MLINTQNLQFLFLQFSQIFKTVYSTQPVYWQFYASEMPSSTEKNVYGWLAQFTGMREWVGPRQVDNASARDYELKNKDYEKTVGLERNKVLDDQFGFFSTVIEQLALQGAWWPDDICTDAIVNGTTDECFDGQPFFDTDHPVDLDNAAAGTYSNKLTGAQYDLGGSGNALAAYKLARAAMMKVKGESGRSLNLIGNVLMVPPDLEGPALEVGNAQLTAQAIKNAAGTDNVAAAAPTNVFQGTATVVVNPRLTDQTVWYLLCTTRGVKPILFQKRQAPTLVQRTAPTDPSVFDKKEFLYGADARGSSGYSFPFLAFRMAPA